MVVSQNVYSSATQARKREDMARQREASLAKNLKDDDKQHEEDKGQPEDDEGQLEEDRIEPSQQQTKSLLDPDGRGGENQCKCV